MSSLFNAGLTKVLTKLERREKFSPAARSAFLNLPHERRNYPAGKDIVREGERTGSCRFLLEGTVSRSKMVADGGRQIAAFHIAGDLIDLSAALLLVADHTLRTHEPCVVLAVSQTDILRLAEDFPEIARAFWFDTLVDASVFREWSLNLGRRNARERTAHLIMEHGYRMEDAGLGPRTSFAFPITQVDLADALGLTPVHVNRSLRWLREQGYIAYDGRQMAVLDWDGLAEFCGFTPLYLHPEGPRSLPKQSRGHPLSGLG